MRQALEAVDPALETAARSLGAGVWDRLASVTLPLAAPGDRSAPLWSDSRACLGEFGAVITFAANVPGVTQTLPLAIYSALADTGRGGDGGQARLHLLRHRGGGARWRLGHRLAVSGSALERRIAVSAPSADGLRGRSAGAPCASDWATSQLDAAFTGRRRGGHRRCLEPSGAGKSQTAGRHRRRCVGQTAGRVALDAERLLFDSAERIDVPHGAAR